LTIKANSARDYYHDGTVDAADYIIWRKNPGRIYTPDDYLAWRDNFGQSFSFGSGSAVIAAGISANSESPAVPEPATLVMLIFAAVSWGGQRRRPV
jgi:hypothetical protein